MNNAGISPAIFMRMLKMKTRKEIREQDKWDLSFLYVNEQAWKNDFDSASRLIRKIGLMTSKYSSKEEILKCLNLYFSLRLQIQRLHSYAQRKLDEDVALAASNIRLNRINDLTTLFNEQTVFVSLELSRRDVKFLQGLRKDPRFADYAFFIARIIRVKKHLLSENEEKLLARLAESMAHPYHLYGKINDADLKFADIVLEKRRISVSQANYSILLQDKDRRVRKAAVKSILQPYRDFRESLSHNLFQHIKNNVMTAKLRRHSTAIAEFSFEDDLKPEVYQNLFKETEKHLPLLHRYCQIRKRILGYKELHWHDLYVPLASTELKMDYRQGAETVLSSIELLGDDYVSVSRRALLEQRWVDIYPNSGKRSGAYSSFGYRTPAYILMNYNGNLNSVSTLAHELGHSLHTYLAAQHNPYSNFDYPIFLAEIASTFNEQALADYLAETGNRAMKRYIIIQELEKIRLTFFRQTMFAEFEKKLYDQVESGEMLTADLIESEYLAINQKYYGNGVILDPLIASEWARIPHFYYNFYVYKYATGLAIANYFFEKVKTGDPKELANYLKLLKAGGSNYPAKLLKDCGLDIYDRRYLTALMERFEALLGQLEKY